MSTLLDDVKINNMIGAVSNATSQATGSISQVEQWNSLAQNINGILEKVMSMKNQSLNNQNLQTPTTNAPVGQIMENRVIPQSQPQPTIPNIYIDNNLLRNKIIENLLKLKNLPEDMQNKTLKEVIELAEKNQAMLNTFIPQIANELKECIKWT